MVSPRPHRDVTVVSVLKGKNVITVPVGAVCDAHLDHPDNSHWRALLHVDDTVLEALPIR